MASVFVCGDILNYGCVTGRVCSLQMAEIIANADYSVGNFEGPVRSCGKPQPKSGIHHQQRAETVAGLKAQGFNLLLLANNHIMDYGTIGLTETLRLANEAGLDTLGAGLDSASAYRPLLRAIGPFRVGMINACEAQFGHVDGLNNVEKAGYSWINSRIIDRIIIKLRQECDIVLLFAHAGLEHYPLPQKEWRERYRHFCDLGVDVVVGSHPHVPQGYEVHSGALIFYSLGNFFFDSATYRDKQDQSYSVVIELSRDRPLRFREIYHCKRDGIVQISTVDEQVDLDGLCRYLAESYEEKHDAMSLQVYQRIKRNLRFSLLPFPFDAGIATSLRRIARAIGVRNNKVDKNLLLLHLLRNETYYFATKHALEVIARRNYKNTDPEVSNTKSY